MSGGKNRSGWNNFANRAGRSDSEALKHTFRVATSFSLTRGDRPRIFRRVSARLFSGILDSAYPFSSRRQKK